MNTKKAILFFTVLAIIFGACKDNSLKIDTSQINVKLDFNRFETEFFNLNPDSIYYEIPALRKKYGDFFDIYNLNVIGVGLPDQKTYYEHLDDFFYYCDQMDLYNEVMKVFPLSDDYIYNSLENAFEHYKFYFPDDEIPQINTCISGFNLSVFTGEDFIGISLDKYLGSKFKPYKGMFENYLVRRMTKEMIPVDVMRAWASAKYPFNDSVNTVLTNMIYEGRLQYFIDAMLPETADTLKWGYTTMQWGWANKYESNIWDYMVDNKVLFSNKMLDIKTFTGEAPFTTPFQNNSAPRAGTFIGYKIVKSYLKNNPDVTLPQLMNETDYMKIYNLSYYEAK